MIIVGYQGIGKSTLSKECVKCIDLESSNFWVNGERAENWAEIYANIAVDLSNQGYTVFVSSHKEVRDALKYRDDVFAIVPSMKLKDEWIKKLRNRYEASGKTKDYKAWKNAEDRYCDNIREIRDDIDTYTIQTMEYNLYQMLVEIAKRNLCLDDIRM